MWLGREHRGFLMLVESIAQMYAEEVKALGRTRYGRHNPLATFRIQAQLYMRFWLPIAEMLDPCNRLAQRGGPGLEFFERGSVPLGPYEMEQSLALVRRYLGTPELTLNMWFQLRPIFGNLLKDADHI